MKKSRKLISLGLAVGVLIAATGCFGQNSEEADGDASEGKVTITLAGYSGVFKDEYTSAVLEPYMAANPNVTIKYREFTGSGDHLAALRTEKNNPSLDVSIIDNNSSFVANQEGLYAPLEKALVPNVADIDPDGQTPGGFGPALTYDNIELMYNTDFFPTPPDSWEVLRAEEYKGKVIVHSAHTTFLALSVNHMLGADYQKSIDPAVAWMQKMAPSVQTWSPKPDSYTPVANGSAVVGTAHNARAQLYIDTSGGKLGVVIPKEGTVSQVNTINLVSNSAAPIEAQKFINFALSPEAQGAFAEAMYYTPTNQKTVLSDEAKARTAFGMADAKQLIPVDWSFVGEHGEEWSERIHREVIGQ